VKTTIHFYRAAAMQAALGCDKSVCQMHELRQNEGRTVRSLVSVPPFLR